MDGPVLLHPVRACLGRIAADDDPLDNDRFTLGSDGFGGQHDPLLDLDDPFGRLDFLCEGRNAGNGSKAGKG